MIIYLDLIFFLNFFFDSILLLIVNIVLKRNMSLKRIFLGALVGSLSIFLLFIKISSLSLFLFKIIISIIMILVTFGYKDKKYTINNIGYLYIVSIILGGFLYFLNLEFSYKNEGLIFYNNGLSINFIVLIVSSPIILYLYIKQNRKLKLNYSNYYKTEIYLNNRVIEVNGYLDTGNNLKDPYFNKPIILLEKEMLKGIKIDKFIIVPYKSLNNNGILKCVKVEKVVINGKESNKVLVGLSNFKFNMDGIKCILNNELMEGLK